MSANMLTPFGNDPEPYFSRRGLLDVQIPDDFPKCAVFIGTIKDGNFLPRATGFIASYEQDGYGFWHLITAEHVISGMLEKNEKMYLRANLTNGAGGVKVLDEQWYFHPDEGKTNTDVAVCALHPEWTRVDNGEQAVLDHLSVPMETMAATRALDDKRIKVGEEICIIGLFTSHFGRERNIPIIRVGNIAMLEGDPINTSYKGFMDAYLVEARSIGGLSGSPVFVGIPDRKRMAYRNYYLLGLVHGHFDIQNLNAYSVADMSGSGINAGIGVVIPVRYIVETLRHPDLMDLRREAAMRLRKRDGATPDLAVDMPVEREPSVGSEPPTTEGDEQHRERFTATLISAAKKRPQGG
jgi:hypothetical protein